LKTNHLATLAQSVARRLRKSQPGFLMTYDACIDISALGEKGIQEKFNKRRKKMEEDKRIFLKREMKKNVNISQE
jgi:hypothetical protein